MMFISGLYQISEELYIEGNVLTVIFKSWVCYIWICQLKMKPEKITRTKYIVWSQRLSLFSGYLMLKFYTLNFSFEGVSFML